MTQGRFNLLLSMAACFLAVEAGAMIVCIGMVVLDAGPLAVMPGIALWALAQPIILVIALGSMPLGALVRMILGLAFERPRPVAFMTGGLIGLCGSAFVLHGIKDVLSVWLPLMTVGSVAGIFGGWTWWLIEKPFLDRRGPSGSAEE